MNSQFYPPKAALPNYVELLHLSLVVITSSTKNMASHEGPLPFRSSSEQTLILIFRNKYAKFIALLSLLCQEIYATSDVYAKIRKR